MAVVALLITIFATTGNGSCGPNPHLSPAPRSLEDFQRHVVESPDVVLLHVSDEDYLPYRQMGSNWEKVALTFMDKIRMVEYDLRQPSDKAIAQALGVDGQHDLPFLRIYDGRVKKVRPAPVPLRDDQCTGTNNNHESEECSQAKLSSDKKSTTGSGAFRSPDEVPVDQAQPTDDGFLLRNATEYTLVRGRPYSHGQVKQLLDRRFAALVASAHNGKLLKRTINVTEAAVLHHQ